MPDAHDENAACFSRRLKQEYKRSYASGNETPIEIAMDLASALSVAACLQLALRHPENKGNNAKTARRFVDGVHQQFVDGGFMAHAELLKLGDGDDHVLS